MQARDVMLRGSSFDDALSAPLRKAEWVVYTGPGQVMFHHWIEQKTPPKTGTAAPSTPAGK